MPARVLQIRPPALEPERRAPARPGSSLGSRRAGARRSVPVQVRPARKNSRPPLTLNACVLAGGRSTRMGRDKSRLLVGRRTMLAHATLAAKALGLRVRVIRRDIVPRCGPLGGVLTALRTSRAQGELFLACDMPFVSPALLRKLLRNLSPSHEAAFTFVDRRAGFPFAMRVDCAAIIEAQIAAKEFSLQALARRLGAALVSPPRSGLKETFNINTRADLAAARAVNSRRDTPPTGGRPRRPRSPPGQSTARS